MFEIGFSELLLIGIVALIVLGPERLPKAARQVGYWIGAIQRHVQLIKQELHQDPMVQEMQRVKQDFENEAIQMKYNLQNPHYQEMLRQQQLQEMQQNGSTPFIQSPPPVAVNENEGTNPKVSLEKKS